MTLSEAEIIGAMAGETGRTLPGEIAAERDDFLRRHGTLADQTMHGLVAGKVEILRDRAGVPHVFAASSVDLYLGLGVAMAQDRLWQMDRLRRRALGRQAEVLGPAYLASDIAHLTVGIDRIAAREAEAIDDATRPLVAALVAGINRQIEAFGTDLPIEFRILATPPAPFTVRDVAAIGRGIWWSLNGRIDRIAAAECARFFSDERQRALYLTPEASEHLVLRDARPRRRATRASGTDDATGSNNWAVHGSRTASGKPLLAGDPHQPYWVPSSWYEYGLHGPEDDCAGAGHPGFPGLWWGSNGTAAWAITNNAASTRDLYRETVDPADPRRYREGDGWREFAERTETIPVRGASPHTLTIRETVRGPVINGLIPAVEEGGDPPLSLRWVGMEHIDDLRAGVMLSRAKTWPAFRAALRDWSIAVFNFIYADAAGTIGYQMAGRVPVRGRITPGFRDADNGDDSWRGYIPFDALPNASNPKSGTLASANQRIVGDDYPQPIYGAYSQGHRGARIAEFFGATPTADPHTTIALQNDVVSSRAVRTLPHIGRLLAKSDDADVLLLRDALAGWDGAYTPESVAATVFETFMAQWQRAVLGATLPARLVDLCMQQTGLAMTLLEQPNMPYFEDGTTQQAVAAAKRAVASLRERLGADTAGWNWGKVHLAHWKHPLSAPATEAAFDIGPAPVSGGSHTIRNTGGELPPHGATSGAEYRMVFDFAQPDRFLAVQNIGNSGVPGSPHYRDQFEPFLRGEYHTVHLARASIEADCESTTTILPLPESRA
ncbi:MAG: penicillin acylase family protein [Acidisphaera sp.]|nr:penicillin acylase family protein [Acidisphaera sp.]